MITKIITQKNLSEQLIKLEIKTSGNYTTTGPGQYIILSSISKKASITLPILKFEPCRETLTALVPANTERTIPFLNSIASESQIELEGPFGQPFRIEKFGSVLCIASYNCMIPLLPVISALRSAGNKITCLLMQNPGTNLLLESEIRKHTDNWIETDENPRRSAQLLEQTLRTQKFDQVIAIGHTKTIRETSTICTATRTPVQSMLYLREQNLQGKHGIYKVSVCGKTHSVCVDGYNFNAHYVSFEGLAKRFGCEATEIRQTEKLKIPV